MNVLIIGGTGLISVGIVKHLLARGAKVTMFNRGKRENVLPANVEQITGDRDQFAEFEKTFETSRYDVVIDMICFRPEQAESIVRTFGGRCEQVQFCSTVCAYGFKVPPHVLVDETFPREPSFGYGENKLGCEQVFERAHAAGKFKSTIVRPSHTYGPGHSLIDQMEFDSAVWDRVERGLPVLCAGDGLGLWVSTHRDDCGKVFAHAALNPKTYGEDYNATHDRNFTWRDYYREAASALGRKAELVMVPASWVIAQNPKRFGFLRDITQFHGAYSSAKAKRDMPEFKASIEFVDGARESFADVRRRNAWRDSTVDTEYQALVDKAIALGCKVETA
jgi:nucleoside-diphosphate-sugar epimerase